MGLLDRIRDLFSSSPRVRVGRDEEAAEREEYGLPDPGEAELRAPGADIIGPDRFAGAEAAEIAEADVEATRRPADPAP